MNDGLTKDDLQEIVRAELQSAIGYVDNKLQKERQIAHDFYMGNNYGNEVDGRSQVKTSDVRDAIEWITPSLVRQFTGYDKAAVFSPVGPEDEKLAEQATDYVNYVINRDNNGFLIYTTALKDGLLSRLGVIKSYWDASEVWSPSDVFEALSEEEFTFYATSDDWRIVEHTEYEIDPNEEITEEGRENLELNDEIDLSPVILHDIKAKRRIQNGRIAIENVPPEEFIVSQDAKFDARTGTVNARFMGHRRRISAGELLEMGFDQEVVDSLPTAKDFLNEEVRNRADSYTDGITKPNTDIDETSREVWVTEAYLNADVDGDGYAELVRVYFGDDGSDTPGGYGELLEFEEWDKIPFSVFSPILIPHTLHGLSIYNLVGDIQLIKSTLARQIMDNLYQTNNPRYLVDPKGNVNLKQLANHKIAGIVQGAPTAVTTLDVPFTAGHSMGMLNYWDKETESRTGVGPSSMGLNPEQLQNTTATTTAIMNTAAQTKVEMIARMFAETAGKHLLKSILHLATKHENKSRLIQLRNEWVEMKPGTWNPEMDVVVNVGLGTGSKEQQLVHLGNLAGKQEQILTTLGVDNPLVTLKQYYNTLSQFVVNAGLKSPDNFFTDPTTSQNQMPAQQSPEMIEAQAEIEIKRAKLEADIALEREKMQLEYELKKEELKAEIELKAVKLGLNPTAGIDVRNPLS